jgi:hypothetical protein
LATNVRVRAAFFQIDEALLVTKVGNGTIFDVYETVHNGRDPRWIVLPNKVGTAEDVPTRTEDPISGAQATSSEYACPRWSLVCSAYTFLCLALREGIVRKKVGVVFWTNVVIVVDDLNEVVGFIFPGPQEEAGAVDGDRP